MEEKPEKILYATVGEKTILTDIQVRKHSFQSDETAEYGGLIRGPEVIGDESRKAMKTILKEIQEGTFAKNWLLENKVGQPNFKGLRNLSENHPIEKVGVELRKMFSWKK